MEPERISFPTEYPIKVVARAGADLRERLDRIFAGHFGEFPAANVSERPSARNNFVALTYRMIVASEAQLAALHIDLQAVDGVVMVI